MRQGFSLLELLIAGLIMAAGIIPMFQMVSTNARLHDRKKGLMYAHFAGKHVLEGIISQVHEGVETVAVHDDFRAVLPDADSPLSPWFESIPGLGSIPSQHPVLYKELHAMLVRVNLLRVEGLETEPVHHARVEVRWVPYGSSEPQTLVLETVVSEYENL